MFAELLQIIFLGWIIFVTNLINMQNYYLSFDFLLEIFAFLLNKSSNLEPLLSCTSVTPQIIYLVIYISKDDKSFAAVLLMILT